MSGQDVQPEWIDTRHPVKTVHNRRTHYILQNPDYLSLSYHQEKGKTAGISLVSGS